MNGSDPEDREVIRGNQRGESAAGASFLADADHGQVVRHDVRENGVLLLDVAISRVRKRAEALRILFVLRIDLNQLAGIRVSGGPEEERVHETEDGRVRADAEGEHGDRGDGKARCFSELPDREFKIAHI
jgi:hypothetical protein